MRKLGTWLLMLAMMLNVFAGMALPANAAEDDDRTGSIQITKYQITKQEEYDALTKRADGNPLPEDELPPYDVLPGVTFTLQRVNYSSGMSVEAPDIDTSFPKVTKITDENGQASFEGLARGVYLLTEESTKDVPDDVEVKNTMKPVLVQIPMPNEVHKTDKDAPEFLWDIYVYPKNLTDPNAPKVEKSVVEPGNMHAGMDIGESFPWFITADIPSGIATGKLYCITDQLETRLDFDTEVDPVVTIPTADGETLTLDAETDYAFSRDTEKADGRLLTFNFTEAGMRKLDTAPTDNRKVTVTFNTIINQTVVERNELGVFIPNSAKLDFTNSIGKEYHTESEKPDVYTGGYTFKKVDGITKEALKGAEFGIFATEEEAKAALVENAIQIAESDEKGLVKFEGLKYGNLGDLSSEGFSEYWIAETKAPVVIEDGVEVEYNLLRKPHKVVVNATSHRVVDDSILIIENNKTFLLPFTGGIGTTLFTVGGIALLAAGGVLFMKGRRKEQL